MNVEDNYNILQLALRDTKINICIKYSNFTAGATYILVPRSQTLVIFARNTEVCPIDKIWKKGLAEGAKQTTRNEIHRAAIAWPDKSRVRGTERVGSGGSSGRIPASKGPPSKAH